MSTRFRFIALAAVCLTLTFPAAPIRAANETGGSAPLWSGLVPEDAFNAVVVYPRRVLTSEAIAKLDIKGLTEEIEQHGGFALTDLEEVVALTGPMVQRPNGRSGEPSVAYICRFSKSYDSNVLLKKWLNKPERFLVAGHRCYRREQTANFQPSEEPCFCFLDERTFVVTTQSWLPAVLNAKDVKSPLVTVLSKTDTSADLTEIFVNSDAFKEMTSSVTADTLPPPLKPFAELPSLLTAAKLTIHTSPAISLRLTLIGNDEASAGKLADLVKSLQQFAQQMLPMMQITRHVDVSAEERESREYGLSMLNKLIDGLVPHQSGKQVTVEFKDLGQVDTLVSKLILPQVREARGAAERVQDMNNLKQFGLAMQMALNTDGHFPAHAIFSKDGKPLLSWRVAILPYVEEKQLYEEFHLDEPWDSAHNKPLIAKMPNVFNSHRGKSLAEGMTRYVVPVGKNTMFDGDRGASISDVTDGLSNTVLAIEVGPDKAVTWTKPDDMPFDTQKPLAGLGTISENIQVLFADGSVHTFRKNIAAEKFRDFILRNDGHLPDWSVQTAP